MPQDERRPHIVPQVPPSFDEPAHLLALETARLLTLVEHLSIGVVIEDESGGLRHVNAQLVRLLRSDADARPVPFSTLQELAPYFADRERARDTLAALRVASGCAHAVLKTRHGRSIELSRLPVMAAHLHGGALWTFSDVTAREQQH